MSARPYRVPAQAASGATARLIDRDRPLRFTFDGRSYTGFAGDTLASALLANGVRLVGRSFKYHRPRGLIGIGQEEPNALVTVGTENRREPNIRATQIELYEGLCAESQNRWPSLDFDVGEINNWAGRLFPSGFYYKTFMGPGRGAWMIYERFIRRAAGLGPAPSEADPDAYEHMHVHCDVLVAGGGVAGLAAARAAAAMGARVIMAEETPRLGGMCDVAAGTIEGGPQIDWARSVAADLAKAGNVHILTRTTVTGHYDHNYLMLAERVADHDPALLACGAPRHRLWKVRARQVIVAAGAIERPLTFANNDRPGVMLASAARAYVARYGVLPGRRGVVFTNNDDAYLTAIALHEAGAAMLRVIDVRANPDGQLVDMAKALGIKMTFGSAISDVATTGRGRTIAGVRLSTLRISGRLGVDEQIDCDFVCVSGGWNPAVHLFSHTGGKLVFDDARQTFVPGATREQLRVVGAANGTFNLANLVAEADAAGEQAARDALGARAAKQRAGAATPAARSPAEQPPEAIWFIPGHGAKNEGNKHFLDLQNDVTAADVELAAREGYRSVEHLKRYTTLGMATDQGKTSNINALGILSDALDRPIPDIGTTTFRPPYSPVSFGAITGMHARDLFQPVRRMPAFGWHETAGAVYEPVGQWRRPYCYPRAGEDTKDAVAREVLAVRRGAGIIDLSTLGKIELQGPDAGAFLDRMYSNVMSTLKEGACRYGLMLDDQGNLIDDGVTVRLGKNRFLIHTTSGNADRIAAWLEFWLQTEWPDLKVFITPVTEQWAQFALAGPKARKILQKLDGSVDFAAAAFPALAFRQGELLDQPVRVYRISYSGELSYEIAVPAGYGRALWDALLQAGEEFDIAPYGTEALHVLRAEKGFIAIGDESDGTVTPHDLGLGWAVSKKKVDFVGKRSLERPYMAGQGRKQLVGILTEDPKLVLPDGAQAVDQPEATPPVPMVGHVTSSYMSPTLERSIALALIKNGSNRIGSSIYFPLDGKVVKASVVEPVFYDKEGARQNV